MPFVCFALDTPTAATTLNVLWSSLLVTSWLIFFGFRFLDGEKADGLELSESAIWDRFVDFAVKKKIKEFGGYTPKKNDTKPQIETFIIPLQE